ncbi:MAG: hypothetical protein EOO60_02415 [Hymenobacter sp.]|nr:MAG: hypothetical protein EOO60_02415 [Hymenobacter sp.]
MHLLYQSATFSLTHDETNNWLYSQWTGVIPTVVAQTECEVILTHVRLLRCTKLLNDSRADEDGWHSLSSWVAEYFIEQLAQEGIVAIAWVLPTHAYALCTTHKVLTKLRLLGRQKPLVDMFLDTESAYSWLTQWPRTNKSVAKPFL